MGHFQTWLDKQPDESCCPDPLDDAEQFDLPLAEDEVEDIIAAHGYDARFTPLDTLMAAPDAMHRAVADHMENYA